MSAMWDLFIAATTHDTADLIQPSQRCPVLAEAPQPTRAEMDAAPTMTTSAQKEALRPGDLFRMPGDPRVWYFSTEMCRAYWAPKYQAAVTHASSREQFITLAEVIAAEGPPLLVFLLGYTLIYRRADA
jgi:hypothetical protein